MLSSNTRKSAISGDWLHYIVIPKSRDLNAVNPRIQDHQKRPGFQYPGICDHGVAITTEDYTRCAQCQCCMLLSLSRALFGPTVVVLLLDSEPDDNNFIVSMCVVGAGWPVKFKSRLARTIACCSDTRDHSFLRTAEFWVQPRNLLLRTIFTFPWNFAEFCTDQWFAVLSDDVDDANHIVHFFVIIHVTDYIPNHILNWMTFHFIYFCWPIERCVKGLVIIMIIEYLIHQLIGVFLL